MVKFVKINFKEGWFSCIFIFEATFLGKLALLDSNLNLKGR